MLRRIVLFIVLFAICLNVVVFANIAKVGVDPDGAKSTKDVFETVKDLWGKFAWLCFFVFTFKGGFDIMQKWVNMDRDGVKVALIVACASFAAILGLPWILIQIKNTLESLW